VKSEKFATAVKFIVIGITDNPRPWFPPEVMELIKQGKVFSGGKRHHEIVATLLPQDAEWIDITAPLDAVFEQYRSQFSVLSSQSSFNSLQMLAHRLLMPYHDMRIVSLTGRPWPEFDRALIERTEKIGILTDKEHTPATIAQRMLEYGYTNFIMYVGEHLGHPTLEKVTTLTLEEAAKAEFSMPNCMILDGKTIEHNMPFGIPDAEFALLDGREKMITKMPIRLLTLQALDLPKRKVFWDIGFCTGSVSIEARLQFPHLHIEAFEIRPECEAIIHENARRHGAPGINIHIGDFLSFQFSVLSSQFAHPDAVFIGGHGGRLKEIMAKVLTVLADDGVIVMNSVKAPKVLTDSHQLWDEACLELGLQQEPPMRIIIDEHHPIEILKCKK